MTSTATTSTTPVAETKPENINNYIDALAYAQMPNMILDSENIDTMIQKYNNISDNLNTAKSELNGMLSQTQIKRACCLYNGRKGTASPYTISVRIPVTSNIDWTSQTFAQIKQQLGFIDKNVKIPQALCPAGFTSGSTECNNFYDLYCSNQRQIFSEATGGESEWNDNEFSQFRYDCSCMNRVPSYLNGVPGTCYMPGCSVTDANIYSELQTPCSATICTQIVNVSELAVGGNAGISANLQNNCGSNLGTAQKTSTQASSANPTATTTNTTTTVAPPAATPAATTTTETSATTFYALYGLAALFAVLFIFMMIRKQKLYAIICLIVAISIGAYIYYL